MPPGDGKKLSRGGSRQAPARGSIRARSGARRSPLATWSEKSNHWAFQPIKRAGVRRLKAAARAETPSTHSFSRLTGKGAEALANKEADKAHHSIRRVTFDLTGLPPTPEEVDAFLNDDSPNAYEKVVDRLLASPHYGERWARHWLDVGPLRRQRRLREGHRRAVRVARTATG